MITGPSGSGKSTFVSSLLRISDSWNGSINITNLDIKELKKSSLRDQIGYMGQKNFIASGVVRRNLVTLTKDELKTFNTLCEEFLLTSETGKTPEDLLEYNVEKFSGGQLKRLILARTLAMKKPIYIIDEPFSGLDASLERLILCKIKARFAESLIILITHNLNNLELADFSFSLPDHRVLK